MKETITREEAARELERLAKEIAYHDDLYYNQAQPILTDHEYDQLRKRNQELEKLFPDLVRADSPSHRVGATPLQNFDKVQHQVPMLSLDNAFDQEDVAEFLNKNRRFLHMAAWTPLPIWAEPKIDGLSASLIYEHGVLKQGATRGDGTVGEDVTQNIKTIQDIPLVIENYAQLCDAPVLEVRGEVYMTKSAFEHLNDERARNHETLFANPRNAAAGSLRQLDSGVTRQRRLRFFAYEVLPANLPFATQQELAEFLRRCGFSVSSQMRLCESLEDVMHFYQDMEHKRRSLAYDIDGVVYKINDRKIQTRLGTVGRVPRHSIAHKFPAEQAETVLRDILIQVGRMGALTPVAVLAPVTIAGATITRATLHNAEEIARKDIRVGDTVLLQRAGDVIPQIVRAIVDKRPADAVPFEFPTTCPCCGRAVVKDEDLVAVRCPAGFQCEAQAVERLAHFVSRDAFDIDGLGDQNIAFLYHSGRVRDYADLFTLEERNQKRRQMREQPALIQDEEGKPLEREEGWGPLSVRKLFKAIQSRRHIPLHRFIYAIGIPQIGQRTAKLLAQHYKTWEQFSACTLSDLIRIEGIGELTAHEITHFLPAQQSVIQALLQHIQIEAVASEPAGDQPLAGQSVVFTGTLQTLSRNEAKAMAERFGARISSSVSSHTSFVVVGENAGKKRADAERLGIPIWTEDEWNTKVQEWQA